ncbi:hypothetical protein GCM10028795_02470 [Lysobacter olei]
MRKDCRHRADQQGSKQKLLHGDTSHVWADGRVGAQWQVYAHVARPACAITGPFKSASATSDPRPLATKVHPMSGIGCNTRLA